MATLTSTSTSTRMFSRCLIHSSTVSHWALTVVALLTVIFSPGRLTALPTLQPVNTWPSLAGAGRSVCRAPLATDTGS